MRGAGTADLDVDALRAALRSARLPAEALSLSLSLYIYLYIYIYMYIYSRFVCSKQTAAPTTGTRPPLRQQ